MYVRSTILGALLCSGCLARDIARKIDEIECGCTEGTSSSSTSAETTEHGSSGVETTTVGGTLGGETTGGETGTSSTGATDSESGDTSSSTGDPMPVCGNGVIEAAGPQPEECDDGNDDPDDGCSDCGRDRVVFITSEDYQGGIFMGLVGADQRCRSLAGGAGLANSDGFTAWLSDSSVSARDRMFAGRGRYVLINGLVVADSWDSLLTVGLKNLINVTEISETKNEQVWTGTTPDGSAAVGADYCADWSGFLDENKVHWGRSGDISQWTIADAPDDQPGDCIAERALYCFEQK